VVARKDDQERVVVSERIEGVALAVGSVEFERRGAVTAAEFGI
jgi:hypothetical protein